MLLNYISNFNIFFPPMSISSKNYILTQYFKHISFQCVLRAFPITRCLVLQFGNEYYNGNEELINYATTTKGHMLILATPATLNVRFCWKYSLFPPPPPFPLANSGREATL
jgi:hypothetical protein